MEKRSRQKKAILDYLQSTNCHPTAEMVYNEVRQIIPTISLGTVYRNLNLMVANRSISKLKDLKGVDHFDMKTEPHVHMACMICGKIEDLDVTAPFDEDRLVNQANKTTQSFCSRIIFLFDGICYECLKSGKM